MSWSINQSLGLVCFQKSWTSNTRVISSAEASGISDAVDKLNRGVIECNGHHCVVYSQSSNKYVMLYREPVDKSQAANLVKSWGTASASWSAQQSCAISEAGKALDPCIETKARLLTSAEASGVGDAVDKLNRGIIPCADNHCIVYSQSSQIYVLLFRSPLDKDGAMKLLRSADSLRKSPDSQRKYADGPKHEPVLLEEFNKIKEALLLVRSPNGNGRVLAELEKGRDEVFEVRADQLGDKDAPRIHWSVNSIEAELQQTVAHPDTRWVRVVRAKEGDLTTWRYYRQCPPEPELTCKQGDSMEKAYGSQATGIARALATLSLRKCSECSKEMRKGALMWICNKCDYYLCCDCAENMASTRGSVKLARATTQGLPRLPAAGRSFDPPGRQQELPLRSVATERLKGRSSQQRIDDSLRRLNRLILHGDIAGATTMLTYILEDHKMKESDERLTQCRKDLKALEAEGPLVLLLGSRKK